MDCTCAVADTFVLDDVLVLQGFQNLNFSLKVPNVLRGSMLQLLHGHDLAGVVLKWVVSAHLHTAKISLWERANVMLNIILTFFFWVKKKKKIWTTVDLIKIHSVLNGALWVCTLPSCCKNMRCLSSNWAGSWLSNPPDDQPVTAVLFGRMSLSTINS